MTLSIWQTCLIYCSSHCKETFSHGKISTRKVMNILKTFSLEQKEIQHNYCIDIVCFSFYLLFSYAFIFPRPQETSETRQAQEFQADQAGVFSE